jgi:DNA-binding transcriptional LysR family regulator
MRELNLHGIDLNLLPALEALLRRRSVTQAALDAGLSQPAMSRALARLRDLFDDPLLVRGRGGLLLSPKALHLEVQLAATLRNVTSIFEDPQFDPRLVKRRIRMAATDFQTIMLVPKIMARLAKEAPGLELSIEPYSRDIAQRMETGALDFVFALASTNLPIGATSESIGRDRLALIMRRTHPAAKRRWTIADYGKYRHATISITGDGLSELDAQLAKQGIQRHIALRTPHFMAALAAVAATDMITTMSEAFARKFTRQFNLVIHEAPLVDTKLENVLVWNHQRSSEPVLTWMRMVVKDVASEVYET